MFSDAMAFHMNGTVFATALRYTYQDTAEEQSGILLDFLEKGIECAKRHIPIEYVVVHYVSDGRETTAAEIYENLEYAGAKAYDTKGNEIGVLKDVLTPGGVDVFVFDTPKGTLMTPALKTVLLTLDADAGRIVLDENRLEEVALYEDRHS